jgi:DNA polymerase
VTKQRGVLIPGPARLDEPAARQNLFLLATVHPSAVLRADDREAAYQGLVSDLRVVAEVLNG